MHPKKSLQHLTKCFFLSRFYYNSLFDLKTALHPFEDGPSNPASTKLIACIIYRCEFVGYAGEHERDEGWCYPLSSSPRAKTNQSAAFIPFFEGKLGSAKTRVSRGADSLRFHADETTKTGGKQVRRSSGLEVNAQNTAAVNPLGKD